MKTSHIKSKNSLLLFALFAATPLLAKPVAEVTEVNGQVFVVTPEGKTLTLKINDHLEEKSEVMVEEGGNVTLIDYFDATYHLVGGSHMKFFTKSVQLKRGKTWIQAKNGAHNLALTTANGHVDFWKSEFITTFDQNSSRSQILVVNGDVEVSNVLDKNLKYAVPAGSFTLLDPEVENGVPRSPTKVGVASLNSALADFKKLPETMVAPTPGPKRGIASVNEDEHFVTVPKKGEIIFINTNRLPASVSGAAHNYYKKSARPKRKQAVTSAPIKFYGVTPSALSRKAKSVEAPRSPASVPIKTFVPQKSAQKVNLGQEFSESLKMHEKDQPKHTKDLENLINDLKSY